MHIQKEFGPEQRHGKERKSKDCDIFGFVERITECKTMDFKMKEMKADLQDNIEKERLRLAQDLHDGPIQDLYSALYELERISSGNCNAYPKSYQKVRQEIQKVINDLRSIAQELRPPALSDFGLENAIRSHVDTTHEKHPNLHFALSLAQDGKTLPENIRLALFRVYQASIANILRHSEAKQVRIGFSMELNKARLEIMDDGKGFSVPASWIELTHNNHFGLAGAAERVESLGGKFTVVSGLDQGTIVSVEIPL